MINFFIFKEICSMDKNEGACSNDSFRYYYDKETRNCKPFRYGGCRGNENNFKSVNDCYRVCNGVV